METEKKEALTATDYQFALHSQTACNLSGLVRSLNEVTSKIWEEARALGKGTDYVNGHPIVRLYAEQINHLASRTEWTEAYRICEEKAKGG